MAERKIRHIENVFTDDVHDKKGKSGGLFKNKKAPQPPSGHKPMPKIGNYQPKILLDVRGPGSNHTDDHHDNRHDRHHDRHHGHHHGHHHHHHLHHAQVHAERRSSSSEDYRRSDSEFGREKSPSPPPRKKREFIIGDKNVPLTIERTIEEEDDQPVPPPRRKRRAPSVPQDDDRHRGHPMYQRSVSQRSDEERLDMEFEEQGGDIDFGPGIDNPGFHARERRVSERSDHSYGKREAELVGNKRSIFPEPAPDYDDEEVTINFDERTEELVLKYKKNSVQRPKSEVYRDVEGDDFGKYMNDDDYEFDNRPYVNGHMMAKYRKEGKYQKGPKPSNKSNKKQKQLNNKRNTIRDFTFSDSKIGWGDRTVKSTSAKGRHIKREKERTRGDMADHFNRRPAPGSYEEFLSIRNGIPLESPNSSDSGVEVEENGRARSEGGFYDHQPKQLRSGGKYEDKPSMWQRLTWRFRRSVEITNPDARY